MVALKLPEHEFKGLLNFLQTEWSNVYQINLLSVALKKSALVH